MAKSVRRLFVVLASAFIMGACSDISNEVNEVDVEIANEDIVQKSMEAMSDVNNITLDYYEEDVTSTRTGAIYLKDQGEQFRMELDRMELDGDEVDFVFYGNADEFLVQINDDFSKDQAEYRNTVIPDTKIDFLAQPLKTIEDIDEQFVEHIDVEKGKDELSLTYIGDDDHFIDMGDKFLKQIQITPNKENFDDIDMKEFSFTIHMDAKSYVVKEVHIKIMYEKSGDENQADYQYTYKAIDEWDEIEKVELPEDEASEIYDAAEIAESTEKDDANGDELEGIADNEHKQEEMEAKKKEQVTSTKEEFLKKAEELEKEVQQLINNSTSTSATDLEDESFKYLLMWEDFLDEIMDELRSHMSESAHDELRMEQKEFYHNLYGPSSSPDEARKRAMDRAYYLINTYL